MTDALMSEIKRLKQENIKFAMPVNVTKTSTEIELSRVSQHLAFVESRLEFVQGCVEDEKKRANNAEALLNDKSMVSIGSQTEYLASLKQINAKQSAYIGGLELMKMHKNRKMITNVAYEYITSEFARWYKDETFEPTIEAINEMRKTLLYIADTISILEEAGVDMNTHKDKVIDFVEDITEDITEGALTYGNRWFNRKIDKFISKYVHGN